MTSDKDGPTTTLMNHPNRSLELRMSLSYYNREGLNEIVAYERTLPKSLSHAVRKKDGTRLVVHDPHLRLNLQPDLSNIPTTSLK